MCDANAVGCADEELVDICVPLLLLKDSADAGGMGCGGGALWRVQCVGHVQTHGHVQFFMCVQDILYGCFKILSWSILVLRPRWRGVLAGGPRDAIRAQGHRFKRSRRWRCAPFVVASPARSQCACS